MPSTKDLIEIYRCKYLVNAEYLKNVLNENKIIAEVDAENNSVLINESDFDSAKIIIQNEKLDESETIDQENFMEGVEEWSNNRLNPGHYLGGNLPYYYRTKSNHMTFAILFFISLVFQIGILFFTNITLWNIIFAIITLIITINFMISGFNYRDEFKLKKKK
ncbi:hypothetical protein J4771_01180 [Candidatus Kaistella beijingensis]|uniref:DUF2007 domain-containing protein n=1 Tax=Candidatus Kaistella beijingensis TaxID=2820270 RepID=UPI001CC764C9|nr:DUF2007 domain-containing protein [Candidatus Kaistella beijingensis]UBB89994.1 hypothetical protein J4771_01180 [Candidatus Kaistella beijingensis]